MKKILFSIICTIFISSSIIATNHTINSGNFYYNPNSLTIEIGDTVTWINDGGLHNVNFDLNTITGLSFNNPASFISQPTSAAILYTHVFNVAGTYNYDCSVGSHAVNGMVGTIIVNQVVSNTVYDIVSNSPDHTTLKTAIDACDLDVTLSGAGPFTLFAPTDAAFNALPNGTVAALLNDIPLLTDILLHHVVGSNVMANMLSNNQIVTTVLGSNVTVTINNGMVFIDNAMVTVNDLVADNGVVHVVDAVLLPYFDCSNILEGTAMIDDCGVCQQAYIYDVVTHSVTFVDDSLNLVLLPTEVFVLPNDTSNPYWNDCLSNSVYDIVANSADHTTLKAAIDACALDGTLSNPGPFTLFAPTDAAFDLLPAGTVNNLLNDIPQLTDILLYHVIGDSIVSGDLQDGQVATTLQGTDITVTVNASGVFIGNAQVIVADVITNNGVVHVVDAVLLPNTTFTIEDSSNLLSNEYMYSVNILGEKVRNFVKNQIYFDVYKDGSVVKYIAK